MLCYNYHLSRYYPMYMFFFPPQKVIMVNAQQYTIARMQMMHTRSH